MITRTKQHLSKHKLSRKMCCEFALLFVKIIVILKRTLIFYYKSYTTLHDQQRLNNNRKYN